MKEGVSLKQDMCYSRTKFCFPPSTIAAAFHSFELQGNIIALYGFLWALDLNNFTMNISNNYSCCFCWCGERLFFLDCWYCAIVFNIWGELRSYSSVDLKGLSCTHTLEHSLMSIMPVKTSWDLVWIIHFIQRFRVPVRSVYASLLSKEGERCKWCAVYSLYCICEFCVCACLLVYVICTVCISLSFLCFQNIRLIPAVVVWRRIPSRRPGPEVFLFLNTDRIPGGYYAAHRTGHMQSTSDPRAISNHYLQA